ncbi:MAG: SurA N-terminal domain-containing protein [Bdellovibrionales bacterium]|nr:SurA N-terminal domain-containing protein [Bdellovibrionales bacterium]
MFDIFTNPKRRKSLFVYIILGMICIVFVFMSDANLGSSKGSTGYAASVNDAIISITELKMATDQVIRVNSMFYGKDYGNTLEQRQQATMQALQSLVSQELMAQAATKSGLYITKEELVHTIVGLPYFQQNGVFSKDAYDYFLRSQHMTAAQFEGQVRKELAETRVNDLFRQSIVKSNMQKKKEEEASSILLQVKYISINKDLMATSAKASQEEIKSVAEDKEMESKLRDLYALNQKLYKQEEKVKVSHILIQPKNDNWDKAKSEIEKIRSETTPQNFAAQAKKYSTDPGSKADGGNLGYVAKGAMVKEFETAAFQLDVGSVSQPVKTEFGYHLLLVQDKKEAKTTSFEDAKLGLAERWIKEQQVENTIKKLDAYLQEGKKSEAEQLLSSMHLKWVESPKFDLAAENLGPLGKVSGLVEEAFKLSADKPYVNKVLPSGHEYYVVKFSGREKAKKTDAVKPDAPQNMASQMVIRKWLQALRESAKIEANPSVLQ